MFDGRLVLLIEASKYDSKLKYRFLENDKKSLLDQLMEIIVALYIVSEEERKIRLKREERERQENLKREAKEIYFDLYNEELKNTKELIKEAENFFLGKKVFDYIEYRKENDKDIESEWVEWALKKAHWIATGNPEVNNILGNKETGTNILEIRERYQHQLILNVH